MNLYLISKSSSVLRTICWHSLDINSCSKAALMGMWWTCSCCTLFMTDAFISVISRRMAQWLPLMPRTAVQLLHRDKQTAATGTEDWSRPLIQVPVPSVYHTGILVLVGSCIFLTSKTRSLQTQLCRTLSQSTTGHVPTPRKIPLTILSSFEFTSSG